MAMTRDEIIRALECCIAPADCDSCPYDGDDVECINEMMRDAIALLEAEPKRGRWEPKERVVVWDVAGYQTCAQKRQCTNCGFIHHFIEDHMNYAFCPHCGARNTEEL